MCNVDESFPVEKVRAIFDGALQRREASGNLKGREGKRRREGAKKRGKTARISLISLIVAFVSSNIGARCYFNSLCKIRSSTVRFLKSYSKGAPRISFRLCSDGSCIVPLTARTCFRLKESKGRLPGGGVRFNHLRHRQFTLKSFTLGAVIPWKEKGQDDGRKEGK